MKRNSYYNKLAQQRTGCTMASLLQQIVAQDGPRTASQLAGLVSKQIGVAYSPQLVRYTAKTNEIPLVQSETQATTARVGRGRLQQALVRSMQPYLAFLGEAPSYPGAIRLLARLPDARLEDVVSLVARREQLKPRTRRTFQKGLAHDVGVERWFDTGEIAQEGVHPNMEKQDARAANRIARQRQHEMVDLGNSTKLILYEDGHGIHLRDTHLREVLPDQARALLAGAVARLRARAEHAQGLIKHIPKEDTYVHDGEQGV